MSYVGRHWRGELSLSQAYFANTVGLNCVAWVFFLAVSSVASFLPLLAVPILLAVYWPALCMLQIWQTTGVVRSALRRINEDIGGVGPALALVAVAIMTWKGIMILVSVAAPQLVDGWNILRGDPGLPPSIVTVLPRAGEIEFSGGIRRGAAAQLEQALQANPAVKVLHLSTAGGREREAKTMAELVRRYGLTTYVGRYCASAGVIVFLGGKERILKQDARLGFHSARAAGVPDEMVNSGQREVLEKAGATTAFIQRVIATPSSALWYPTSEDLLQQGIVTRVTDGAGYSLEAEEIAAYTVQRIGEDLEKKASFRVLAELCPEEYAGALAQAAASVRKGEDMEASLKSVKELLTREFRRAARAPSPAAIDAYLDLKLEVLKRNMYVAPRDTLAVIAGRGIRVPSGLPAIKPVPDYPHEQDERMGGALLASPREAVTALNQANALAQLKAIVVSLKLSEAEKVAWNEIPATRSEQIAACENWQTVLKGIKALPARDRYDVARYLFELEFRH